MLDKVQNKLKAIFRFIILAIAESHKKTDLKIRLSHSFYNNRKINSLHPLPPLSSQSTRLDIGFCQAHLSFLSKIIHTKMPLMNLWFYSSKQMRTSLCPLKNRTEHFFRKPNEGCIKEGAIYLILANTFEKQLILKFCVN